MRYSASTEISASAATVWTFLTDAPRYPEWNSTVVRIDGAIEDGGRIAILAKVQPDRAFPARVAFVEPGRVMTWTGGMPLGLFSGVRTFTLTERGGATRVEMVEVFSGLLTGLMKKVMPDLQPAFDQFVADLKRAAESGPES